MYCKECGKQIANDSKFCPYCGTKLDMISDFQNVASYDNKTLNSEIDKCAQPIHKLNKGRSIRIGMLFLWSIVLCKNFIISK